MMAAGSVTFELIALLLQLAAGCGAAVALVILAVLDRREATQLRDAVVAAAGAPFAEDHSVPTEQPSALPARAHGASMAA